MDLEAELVDHIDRGDIQKVFECIYRGKWSITYLI